MGSTTTHGFPFPVGTDRVMDGDNAIQALAQYTDDYLLGGKAHRCRIAYATGLSIPNNVVTDLSMVGATVAYDTGGMANVANNRIDIKTTALYVITLTVGWQAPGTPTGNRDALIFRNSVSPASAYIANDYRPAQASSSTAVNLVTDPLPLTAGDSIVGRVLHTQGAVLTTLSQNGVPCSLTVAMWMGQ